MIEPLVTCLNVQDGTNFICDTVKPDSNKDWESYKIYKITKKINFSQGKATSILALVYIIEDKPACSKESTLDQKWDITIKWVNKTLEPNCKWMQTNFKI